MADANGHLQCCIGDQAQQERTQKSLERLFAGLKEVATKTPEEKLADSEKELSALKDTCKEIRSDLRGLMTDIRGFASLAENEFYDRMILKMILTAKNNLDESINDERRQIAVIEENLMRNIFRRGVLQLLSDFLNREKLT